MTDCITRRIRVYGIVQGVGFRPTVSRHADRTGITGTVCNRGSFVEIYAQGSAERADAFLDLLRRQPPRRAEIVKLVSEDAPDAPVFSDFRIIESAHTAGEIYISPDIALCDDCAREMDDPHDRRFRHPFINCTCCGPRMTILDALPYDRERTSMKVFPMCPDCASEYYDPATRRFDAQPVCCNDCGPQVYLLPPEPTDEPVLTNERLAQGDIPTGLQAISQARKIIAAGGIVAVKGIGGYHLCCDAFNAEAVNLLRSRKTRPMKPFAVMARDIDAAARLCEISPAQRDILTGHRKPILLLRKRSGCAPADPVAPDNPKLGVMLPYAPVHRLLFHIPGDDGTGEWDGIKMPDCLVMTSGNVRGAPICRDDRDASRELGRLCDAILSHNRRIRIRADDTVLDLYNDKPYMIRRSRGYAPLPFLVRDAPKDCVLGIGGELKNSFCVADRGLFYVSPYIGDLADLRTVNALNETAARFQTLLEAEPKRVVCDLHPGYNSTAAAKELGLPVRQIQHHYAHVLSCMAENDFTQRVIGVSLDGTGYGTDGTVWGGEILCADVHGFDRAAHIAPFQQVGGDTAAREGRRIASAMIYALSGRDKQTAPDTVRALNLWDETPAKVLMTMADRGVNTVVSTSAGRLFDAVSAVLGIRTISTFEGEASTALQFAAERYLARGGQTDIPDFPVTIPGVLPTDALFRYILRERLADGSTENAGRLAYIFHAALAAMITDACVTVRDATGLNTVALTGGVYQNLLLLRESESRLTARGFRVLIHSLCPPNDGGLALGQALYGLYNP